MAFIGARDMFNLYFEVYKYVYRLHAPLINPPIVCWLTCPYDLLSVFQHACYCLMVFAAIIRECVLQPNSRWIARHSKKRGVHRSCFNICHSSRISFAASRGIKIQAGTDALVATAFWLSYAIHPAIATPKPIFARTNTISFEIYRSSFSPPTK